MKQTSHTTFRVLFISGAGGGTRRYRCFQPQEQLELTGISTGFRVSNDILLFRDVLEYDLFIFHRTPYTPLIRDILNLVHQRGKIAIFETDDLVFEPGLVRHDSYYRNLSPAEARQYVRLVRGCRETLERCDYALTTTGFLAGMLQRRGKQVLINRNALGQEFVRLAQEACVCAKRASERLVIGYISGSASHNQDFETASDALLYVMNKYPQVELRIIGHLKLNKRFDPFLDRVRMVPFIPWDDVPRELSAIDINIAPLEIENPFCQSKSEVKYFEAGILGVPTVASRTEAFEFAVRHGETGLLAGDTGEWIECLELLITNPSRRLAIGEAAHCDVLRNYTPSIRGQQFAQMLRALVAQHGPVQDTLQSEEQIEYQLTDLIARHLDKGNFVTDYSCGGEGGGPSSLFLAREQGRCTQHQHVFEHSLQRALQTIRRGRRTPQAQTLAWAKSTAKRLMRRVYLLKVEDETYRLMDELTGGQTFGQVFQAAASNLCAVNILLATFGRVNTPDIVLRLKTFPPSEVDLATCTVSAAALQDNSFLSFAFDPRSDSAGRQYYFSIESPDAVRGDAVGLCACLNDLNENTLYRNGQPMTGQLAFVLVYKSLDDHALTNGYRHSMPARTVMGG